MRDKRWERRRGGERDAESKRVREEDREWQVSGLESLAFFTQ